MPIPSVSFTISETELEYRKICQALFGANANPEGLAALSPQDLQKTLADLPASKTNGLFGYFKGISSHVDGYTWAEAQVKYQPWILTLKGGKYYLMGSDKCPINGDHTACFAVKSGADQSHSPESLLDAQDDVTNLLGAFYLLRAGMANELPPETCTFSAATFDKATADTKHLSWPCAQYDSHNLLVTLPSLFSRGLTVAQESVYQQDLAKWGVTASSCAAAE